LSPRLRLIIQHDRKYWTRNISEFLLEKPVGYRSIEKSRKVREGDIKMILEARIMHGIGRALVLG
jgi:hypothetical protein